MEADRGAVALEHGALQIVVEGDPGHPAPCREGPDMTAQEVLHVRAEAEAHEEAARPGQHGDKAHQRAARTADLKVPEVRPVNLHLFARQGAQAQVGLGRGTRPVPRDEVAEVIGAARIAARLDHAVQAAGRQARKLRERLQDEGQIGVDRRGAAGRPEARQARLGEYARDGVAVKV